MFVRFLKLFKRFNGFNKFKRLEIFVCRCWCFHQSSNEIDVQKVQYIQYVQEVGNFRLPMLVFSPIIKGDRCSIFWKCFTFLPFWLKNFVDLCLRVSCLCVFAPLRSLRETKTSCLRVSFHCAFVFTPFNKYSLLDVKKSRIYHAQMK